MPPRKFSTPDIEYVEPPPIKGYFVISDQLERIQDTSSTIGHDFSIFLASVSIFVTSLLTYLSVSTLTDLHRSIFLMVMAVTLLLSIYTILRWHKARKKLDFIIDSIKNPVPNDNN